MHDDLRSIGAVARDSGLPVSALRFYDAAGVLRPAVVDRATGYRWYTSDQCNQARLVARLRQAQMPIPDICDVLVVLHDPVAAQAILDRHLQRLEDDLAVARDHLTEARAIVADPPTTCFIVDAAELRSGFHAVGHAVGTDPDRPELTGVLLDFDGTTLRLVATDRHRLAVSTVAARNPSGPPGRAIAPAAFCTALPQLPEDVPVALRRDLVRFGAHQTTPFDGAYPDWERLVRTSAQPRVEVATDDLLALTRPEDDGDNIVVVRLDGDAVAVVGRADPDGVAFDRALLRDVARARPAHRLTLALDGVRGALSMVDPDRPDDVSLLMPIRLHN